MTPVQSFLCRIHLRLRNAASGMEAVEGLIVITAMTFVLVLFMAFLFMLYQQSIVEGVARDTAYRIAQSYAYPNSDPIMGFTNRAMRLALDPYRYNIFSSLEDDNEDRGEKYARWYLKRASFAIAKNEPSIEISVEKDGLAQRHVEVRITADYEIPLGGMLQFIGQESTITYHGFGCAPCVDLMDYIHTVNTSKALLTQTFGSKALGMVNSVLSLAQNIRNAIMK